MKADRIFISADYRQREYLTEAEVAKLVDAAGNSRNPIRDRLMIRMAFLHALRVSELVNLRWWVPYCRSHPYA
jgi:integrase